MKRQMHTVFVYGTLLAGEGNHRCLHGAEFLGEATLQTAGWKMLGLGGFPALVPGQSPSPIKGELYRVDTAGLAVLDRLEGYHPEERSMYDRITVSTSRGEALIYVMHSAPRWGRKTEIPSGSWRTYQHEQHAEEQQS